MKTARFSQVVAKCGEPAVHDQWVAPAKDRALKKAVKEQRVMSVITHSVGSTKDHGEVGLVEARQRVLLVFPKSLRAYAGRRIVGINYELLKKVPERAAKKSATKTKRGEPDAQPAKKQPRSSEEVLRLFRPDEEDTPAEKAPKTTPRKQPRPAAKRPERKPAKKRKAPPARASRRTAASASASAESPASASASASKPTDAAARRLRTQIQKALKQLKGGKAVQAYQTLEAALQ